MTGWERGPWVTASSRRAKHHGSGEPFRDAEQVQAVHVYILMYLAIGSSEVEVSKVFK